MLDLKDTPFLQIGFHLCPCIGTGQKFVSGSHIDEFGVAPVPEPVYGVRDALVERRSPHLSFAYDGIDLELGSYSFHDI